MGYIWNLATDSQENCYLIATDILRKVDANNNNVWDAYRSTDSMDYYNAVVDNDTMYVCGSGSDNGNFGSMVSLYSAQTGQFITSYFFDLLPNVTEASKYIIKDGNDIYLAGIGGDYMERLFLAKVSLNNNITTQVEKIKDNTNLRIYPNPTQGLFQIEYADFIDGLQISVSDAKGKIVYVKDSSKFEGEYKTRIDLSKQAKGVYFIEILVEKTREVKKLVVE
jgi:hypothetical protein